MKRFHQLLLAIVLSCTCALTVSAGEMGTPVAQATLMVTMPGQMPGGDATGHVPCGETLPGEISCGGMTVMLGLLQNMLVLA